MIYYFKMFHDILRYLWELNMKRHTKNKVLCILRAKFSITFLTVSKCVSIFCLNFEKFPSKYDWAKCLVRLKACYSLFIIYYLLFFRIYLLCDLMHFIRYLLPFLKLHAYSFFACLLRHTLFCSYIQYITIWFTFIHIHNSPRALWSNARISDHGYKEQHSFLIC